MAKVSVIIISKNEAQRIKDTLTSVRFADEIILVDSQSSDDTVRIAQAFNAKIFQRQFDDFSSQKNFALSKCTHEWVLSVDCDEVVSQDLMNSIEAILKQGSQYCAFKVKRINKLFGKVLKHLNRDDHPVRFFKRDKSSFFQPIHEYVRFDGELGELNGELFHNTTPDLQAEFDKTERYTELEARWMLKAGKRISVFKLLFYPLFIFLKLYILDLGVLDGKAGFLYSIVSARYSFIKYRKARALFKDPAFLESIVTNRFNEIALQFPDSINAGDARLLALLERLPKTRTASILEVGCGKGRFIGKLENLGFNTFGCDVSFSLLEAAAKRNKSAFLLTSATSMSLRAESFDAMYAIEVIEHIPDIEKFFLEASRVLKKNGRLVIIDKNILSLNNRRSLTPNAIVKRYHEYKNEWMYPKGFPYRERWFLKANISKLLRKHFSQVRAEYILSDAEHGSAAAFLFRKCPFTRYFIVWNASEPKNI